VNKKIVIIGASSGIGKALGYYYLNQGANVVLVGKKELDLKEVGRQFPKQAICVVADISNEI